MWAKTNNLKVFYFLGAFIFSRAFLNNYFTHQQSIEDGDWWLTFGLIISVDSSKISFSNCYYSYPEEPFDASECRTGDPIKYISSWFMV